LLEKVTRDHNIKTKVDHVGPSKRLNNKQKSFLFKAVKELITNAIKYSKAESLNVSIEYRNEDTIVSVADNGVGFDISDKEMLKFDRNHGFGLFIIKEQLGAFGGSIKINSEKGHGTTVSITMPTIKKRKRYN
jgi:two-component system sensor histidine kinase ComP